jgi:hypothetical protein
MSGGAPTGWIAGCVASRTHPAALLTCTLGRGPAPELAPW